MLNGVKELLREKAVRLNKARAFQLERQFEVTKVQLAKLPHSRRPQVQNGVSGPAGETGPSTGTRPDGTLENVHDDVSAQSLESARSATETSGSPTEVVLLIHGIRTQAVWQKTVKKVLQEIDGVIVQESSYGYFDVIRFWCPFLTRNAAIEEVKETIQELTLMYPNAKLSVIAHSNGTYIITKLLQSERNLKIHRLVLCGSIVHRGYPWHTVNSRLHTNVVNDYGTRDFWPVLAKALSWGYGDTGRHRFGKPSVRDRGHEFRHGDYFGDGPGQGEAFVRTFWKPWFANGTWFDSNHVKPSPWWLSILSILPLQWIMIFAICFGVYKVWPTPKPPSQSETAKAPDAPEVSVTASTPKRPSQSETTKAENIPSSSTLKSAPIETSKKNDFSIPNGVKCVRFNSSGNQMVSGSREGTVKVWKRVDTHWVEQYEFSVDGLCVYSVDFGSSQKWIVAGGGSIAGSARNEVGLVRAWSLERDQPPIELTGHSRPVRCISVNGDGTRLVTGSVDGQVILWAITEDGAKISYLELLWKNVSDKPDTRIDVVSVGFSNDGQQIAIGALQNVTALFRFENDKWNKEEISLLKYTNGVASTVQNPWSVSFNEDGNLIAWGTGNGCVEVLDVKTKQLKEPKKHVDGSEERKSVWSVKFSRDGKWIVSGGDDGKVKLWKVGDPDCFKTLDGNSGPVESVDFGYDSTVDKDPKMIVGGTSNGTVKVWDIASGAELLVKAKP